MVVTVKQVVYFTNAVKRLAATVQSSVCSAALFNRAPTAPMIQE